MRTVDEIEADMLMILRLAQADEIGWAEYSRMMRRLDAERDTKVRQEPTKPTGPFKGGPP